MDTDETEQDIRLRVERLRAVKWIYLSASERQTVLDYRASYRSAKKADPELMERLRRLLWSNGF